MAQAKDLFVIAGRFARSRRLNHEVYPYLEAAKAALDHWEMNEDPDRKSHEDHERLSRQAKSYGRAEPKPNHNNRNFEVIDLESHINYVSAVSHELGERGLRNTNTTKTCIDLYSDSPNA